jgi:hypothetical protein
MGAWGCLTTTPTLSVKAGQPQAITFEFNHEGAGWPGNAAARRLVQVRTYVYRRCKAGPQPFWRGVYGGSARKQSLP